MAEREKSVEAIQVMIPVMMGKAQMILRTQKQQETVLESKVMGWNVS
jgi:hypothetical protein